MKRFYVFPSVFEETSNDFAKVATNFIDGMKIQNFRNNRNYMIGNLALNEGVSPHKFLNSSPQDIDYQLLASTSLILGSQGSDNQMIITVGFPYITHPLYRDSAIQFFNGNHQVSFDTRTFGGPGIEKVSLNVKSTNVLTEIDGCIKAIREGQFAEKQNFFVCSLGYGTFEVALSTVSGVIQRTTYSVNGIHYAVNIVKTELEKHYYLHMLTQQQVERAFQRGTFVINRHKLDVTEIRAKALQSYYTEVISPAMRLKLSDEDFLKTSKLYLVGGGAMYKELVDMFIDEFNGVLEVITYPEPYLCASEGYCLQSLSAMQVQNKSAEAGGGITYVKDNVTYIGIDIGNSNTVVTVSNGTD